MAENDGPEDKENAVAQSQESAVKVEERYRIALQFYETLKKTQWLDPVDLSRYQEKVIHQSLPHARQEVPFYKERLAVLDGPDGALDLSRWLEVPLLTRDEVIERSVDLRPYEAPSHHGSWQERRSSSSSGRKSVSLRSTVLEQAANAVAQFRFNEEFGIDVSKELLMFRAIDSTLRQQVLRRRADPELASWGAPWIALEKRGKRRLFSVHMKPERVFDLIDQFEGAYVNTSPSKVVQLARHAAVTGRRPKALKMIMTVGETLTNEIRAEARSHLGVELVDNYSTAECGVIACQCPDVEGSYHIHAEQAVVEVLKEDGTPCRPGETGVVVVTPLYNFAMPLVRYVTEDYATVGPLCACGRSMPCFSKILGRRKSLFERPGGGLFRMDADFGVMDRHLKGRRWQIAQVGKDQLELRYYDANATGKADPASAVSYAKELAGPEFKVTAKEVPALGLNPGGKFLWTVNEL